MVPARGAASPSFHVQSLTIGRRGEISVRRLRGLAPNQASANAGHWISRGQFKLSEYPARDTTRGRAVPPFENHFP